MQANKRVSQLQHNGRLSRGTYAYPGANGGDPTVQNFAFSPGKPVEGHLGNDRNSLSPEIAIELMPHVGRVSLRWHTSGRYGHDSTSPVTMDHQVVLLGSLRLAGRACRGVWRGGGNRSAWRS